MTKPQVTKLMHICAIYFRKLSMTSAGLLLYQQCLLASVKGEWKCGT